MTGKERMTSRLAHHGRRSHAGVNLAANFGLAMFIWKADVKFISSKLRGRGRRRGGDELIFSFNFGAVADDRRGVAGPHDGGAAAVRAETVIGVMASGEDGVDWSPWPPGDGDRPSPAQRESGHRHRRKWRTRPATV